MKLSIVYLLPLLLILLLGISACKSIQSNKKMENKLKKLEQFNYSFGDASVPPPFHRSYSIAANKDTIVLTVDSYGEILANKSYPMPKDGLAQIGKAIIKNKITKRQEKKENDGCTGGTSRAISYSCTGEKESFSASAYYCGGKQFGTLAGDIDSFFVELKTLVPDFGAVLQSTQ